MILLYSPPKNNLINLPVIILKELLKQTYAEMMKAISSLTYKRVFHLFVLLCFARVVVAALHHINLQISMG
jgi:hypothetical protein